MSKSKPSILQIFKDLIICNHGLGLLPSETVAEANPLGVAIRTVVKSKFPNVEREFGGGDVDDLHCGISYCLYYNITFKFKK